MLPLIIRSGGQTGADQAAIDAARMWGVPFEGWVPADKRAENGPVPDDYGTIQPTPESDPRQRTEWNVRDSDGTLIVSHGELTGGSKLTLESAQRQHKPCLHLDLSSLPMREAIDQASVWVSQNAVRRLNVAGPPHSIDPRAYAATLGILTVLLNPYRPAPGNVIEICIAQTLDNFRHWDSLRWGVVEWLVGLTAGLVTITAVLAQPNNEPDIRTGAWVLAAFGSLAVLLQTNLIRYHRRTVSDVNARIQALAGRSTSVPTLDWFLPFRFTGPASLATATAWLLVGTVGLTAMCALVGWFGPWWLR